jgi:predicted Zn-dependent protease
MIALLIVAALFLIPQLGSNRRDPVLRREVEDPAQRRAEIQAAFQSGKPAANAEAARELIPLFDELGKAFLAHDHNRVLAKMDLLRMTDETFLQGFCPPEIRDDRIGFAQGLATSFRQTIANQVVGWTEYEIRSIKMLGNQEMSILVRHNPNKSSPGRMRWWVTKQSGEWKVYDFENLKVGTRNTAYLSSSLAISEMQHGEFERAIAGIDAATTAMNDEGDFDKADKILAKTANIFLPKNFDALRMSHRIVILIAQGKPAPALAEIERARKANPGMPFLDLLQGTALNQLGKPNEALPLLEAYHDLLGDDSSICRQLGFAFQRLDRNPEACLQFRKTLDFNATDQWAYQGLVQSLGAGDDHSDLEGRFIKLGSLEANYKVIATDCERRHDGKSLEPIARAMRKINPDFPAAEYDLALVKLWDGKTDESLSSLKSVLEREKDPFERQAFRNKFLAEAALNGKSREAYVGLPEPRETFRALAANLKSSYRFGDLRRLVVLHAKSHPDDPFTSLYRGEILVYEENYPEAARMFAAGTAKPLDSKAIDDFRSSRVLAAYHTGQALAAYEAIGAKRETFSQLSTLCLQDSKLDILQSIISRHALADAADPQIPFVRMRLLVRCGQFNEAAAMLKADTNKKGDKENRGDFERVFLSESIAAGRMLEGYRAAPDPRRAFETLTRMLEEEEVDEDFHQLCEEHRKRQPDDIRLVYYTGTNLLQEKSWDKAAETFRKGLKDAPEDLRRSFRIDFLSAMARAGKALEAYRQVDSSKDAFPPLANELVRAGKTADLQSLIEAHRLKVDKNDPDLLFNQMRLEFLNKQPDKAVAIFRDLIATNVAMYPAMSYRNQFLTSMCAAGRELEAYRLVPDKTVALDVLAGELLRKKQTDRLTKLLDEFKAGHSDGAESLYWTGRLEQIRNKPAEAERAFAAALSKSQRENWQYRDALYQARIELGKAVDTYREFGANDRVFEQLAQRCLEAKNAAQLEKLIAVHRSEVEDDPSTLVWQLDLLWLKKDYLGALKLLDKHRGDVFGRALYRWKADDYRVRGLVKLNRSAEAVKEAESQLKSKRGSQLLVVLAQSAIGGAKAAIETMAKMKAKPGLISLCYQDPDLGPMLKSEPFRAFRDKYPEPKEEASEFE